ncbi:uncharacterized protein PHA67_015371 isoform 1-T1 [Liasis olivaceus]
MSVLSAGTESDPSVSRVGGFSERRNSEFRRAEALRERRNRGSPGQKRKGSFGICGIHLFGQYCPLCHGLGQKYAEL